MSALLFEVEPDRDVVTDIISQHQWKGYTKEGAFRCKAGCVVSVLNAPALLARTQTSALEAQHQADMLLSIYKETGEDT